MYQIISDCSDIGLNSEICVQTNRLYLRAALGNGYNDRDGPAYRLPQRKIRMPNGEPVLGNEHKPLQVNWLAWAMGMEWSHGGGICGDVMGLGKTHLMIALLIIQNIVDPADLPTLVLCPNALKKKTYDDMNDHLGDGWSVFQYGQNHRQTKILLDQRCPPWTGMSPGQCVVIMSFEEASRYKLENAKALRGMFHRVMVDAAHHIRRLMETKTG